ncbi:sugar phosphate nucleotidyltransferase, partial [Solemya velum gill symbiont]|uniref:sugar phosphate nucleotidyltransferase n=1 Tax=Solemya velum gill symbiont TaxID=2340 RepID=UPI002118BBF1
IEVPIDEARGFGVMSVDEDLNITKFTEKPTEPDPMPGKPDKALASMGIYGNSDLFPSKHNIDIIKVRQQSTDISMKHRQDEKSFSARWIWSLHVSSLSLSTRKPVDLDDHR